MVLAQAAVDAASSNMQFTYMYKCIIIHEVG